MQLGKKISWKPLQSNFPKQPWNEHGIRWSKYDGVCVFLKTTFQCTHSSFTSFIWRFEQFLYANVESFSKQLCCAHVQSWPVAIFSLQIYSQPGCGGSEWAHSPHGLVSQTAFYIPAICRSRNLPDRQLFRLVS